MLAGAIMRHRQTTTSPPADFTASEDVPRVPAAPDRRKRRRLPLALIARIEPVSAAVSAASIPGARPTVSRRLIGHLRDISNQGAYLWSDQHFATGQTLRLTLEVPPDQGRNWTLEIECETEVVRVGTRHPQTGETGVAVRILRFTIPKVLPAADSFFPFGDQTDSLPD